MSGEAPFVTHLTELRRRIIVVAVSLGVGAGVAYAFVDPLADALLRLAPELTFITLSPPELFLAYVRISVIVGIIATLPVTLSQLWLFLRPALTTREKRLFVLAIATGTVFFFGGAAFAYFIIVPTVLRFFVQFSTQTIQASYSFGSYVGFVLALLAAFGAAFEMPVLLVLAVRLGLLDPSVLRRTRKYVALVLLVLAALITPPDVVSQLMLAGPMYVLFELSIAVSSIMQKRSRVPDDASARGPAAEQKKPR
jgi:sec-independent protein translocase protein TatC